MANNYFPLNELNLKQNGDKHYLTSRATKTQIFRAYWVPMELYRFHTSDHAFVFIERCLLLYEKSTNVFTVNAFTFTSHFYANFCKNYW